MAYNKNAKIDINAIISGSAALEAVRGTGTWGAGYLYSSGGLTNDIKVISDTMKYLSTSGAYATDAELYAVSGFLRTSITELQTASGGIKTALNSASGTVISAISTLSGYIVSGPFPSGSFTNLTVATDIVSAVSGTATIGSKYNPIRASGLYMRAANSNVVMALSLQADGTLSGVPA
jgi:hypothetical protein